MSIPLFTSAENPTMSAFNSRITAANNAIYDILPTEIIADAAVASFVDGANNVPVKALTVNIDAVQAGSGDPYPRGSSKNLLDMHTAETGTSTDVTFTVIKNAGGDVTEIKASGTANGASRYFRHSFTLPAGEYIVSADMSKTPSGLTFYLIKSSDSSTVTPATSQTEQTFTLTEETELRFVIRATNGTNTNNTIFYPMIREATEASGFVPYGNIRPISGFSECVVARAGANLFDASTATDGRYVRSSDGTLASGANYAASAQIPVMAGVTYSLFGSAFRGDNTGAFYKKNGDTYTYVAGLVLATGVDSFVVPAGADYMRFTMVKNNKATTLLIAGTTSITDYTYRGQEWYTIDLGGTCYGGTRDVVTGKLTLTHSIVDLGTLTYARVTDGTYPYFRASVDGLDYTPSDYVLVCSHYKTIPGRTAAQFRNSNYDFCITNITNSAYMLIGIQDSRYDDKDSLKAALNGAQLVFKLATPIVVDLTPVTNISTLKGTNNIWANTGNISVEYYADIAAYIENRGFVRLPFVVTQPTTVTAAINDNVTFSTLAAGRGLAYRWQYYTGGAWTDYMIATADTPEFTFKVTSTRLNYAYRCKITDGDGIVIYTDTVGIIEAT